MDNIKYTPVSCQFMDYVEHYATLRQVVPIAYRSDEGHTVTIEARISTWELRQGVEYLIIADGPTVRMDHVISIADKILADMDDTCSLQ